MVIFTHNIAKFAITDEYHIDREIRDWEQLETDREISEMALENGRMVIISPISANEVERSTRRGRIKQDDRPAHPAELSTASREWLIAVRA